MSNQKLVEYLQRAANMEMTAAHQYQLHAHTLEDWGLTRLAAKMREEMTEEIDHSDRFIERIFFLKGTPAIAFDKPPHKAESLTEMLKTDLDDESEAISFYIEAARHANEVGDIGSRALFEEVALDEEGHKAWLELQLELIERIGEKTYSAKQIDFGGEDAAAAE